jgi:aspartate ammonia-lyase
MKGAAGMNTPARIEHDFLGQMEIPETCYYGIQTLRAVDNFQITGITISSTPEMVKALAYVKKAACLANCDLQVLQKDVTEAIVGACDDILDGRLHDQFVVDIIQGGAGTSTNMNANEVIANRALEIIGRKKGDYSAIHPNNQVNCSQSTNDVYPTAFRLALYCMLTKLAGQAHHLQIQFAAKAAEFSDVIKMGRTQLQDAVPMTLGQEFAAYATTIGEDIDRLLEARNLLQEINLGATAIGTAINTPRGYATTAVGHLRRLTGIQFVLSPNLIEATWDTGAYVQVSGVLKRFAIKLSKICNDLRLLSSGPRAGFNEINLPKMQPGSSIMPGKVNPVIPEMVNQVAYLVVGADMTISMTSENGQLELNVMEPVIAHRCNDATLPITLAWVVMLILAAVPPSGLCHAENGQTVRNRVIIVGGDHNYPPYEFLGGNGEPQGYNVEMTKAIASVMGLEVRIVLGPWNDMFGKLKGGEIDIIQGILKSPEREEYLSFSAPYAIVAQSIFARKGGYRNISVADLRGREVIVQHNGFMEEYLRRISPETIFIQEETHVDALRLLAAGEHDFAVVAVPLGIYLQKKYHLSNIEPVSAPLTNAHYCYAVKKNRLEILDLFSSGLAILVNTGVQQELHAKWLGGQENGGAKLSQLLRLGSWVLTPLLLIIVAVVIWNTALKRKVAKRTRELEERQQQLIQADKLASRSASSPRVLPMKSIRPTASS